MVVTVIVLAAPVALQQIHISQLTPVVPITLPNLTKVPIVLEIMEIRFAVWCSTMITATTVSPTVELVPRIVPAEPEAIDAAVSPGLPATRA